MQHLLWSEFHGLIASFFIRFSAVISLYISPYYMKETAFSFVSLQQQRPDLPRLLVSTATVDDSVCLSLSLSWHAAYLYVCCMLRLARV
jgi:hypothetical protein